MKSINSLDLMRMILKFIREGWIWILLPSVIVLLIVLFIILFGNPYQEGALHGKFILVYSFFGGQ